MSIGRPCVWSLCTGGLCVGVLPVSEVSQCGKVPRYAGCILCVLDPCGKGRQTVLLCSGAPRLAVAPLLSWLLWLRYMDTGLAGPPLVLALDPVEEV